MDGRGGQYAFIQVITEKESWNVPFPFSEFTASGGKFAVKIGSNTFSENGVWLDMDQEGLRIKGRIGYGRFTPIQYDIMGPFSCLPFLECRHAIHSLCHTLNGSLLINDILYDFSGGTGYIEQDWGVGFPRKYIWMQSFFPDDGASPDEPEKGCLFLSIADIPFLGKSFTGCICIVYTAGTEYRLATYLGVRIIQAAEKSVILLQGKHTLLIDMEDGCSQDLRAPRQGEMSRTIRESESCRAHIRFFEKNTLLLDRISEHTSFEYAE